MLWGVVWYGLSTIFVQAGEAVDTTVITLSMCRLRLLFLVQYTDAVYCIIVCGKVHLRIVARLFSAAWSPPPTAPSCVCTRSVKRRLVSRVPPGLPACALVGVELTTKLFIFPTKNLNQNSPLPSLPQRYLQQLLRTERE